MPPRRSTSSVVRWVACTALVSGPSAPASASRRVGVTPYAARQPSFSATCSDRCTCSGRPAAAATTVPSWSRGTARTEWIAAPWTTPAAGLSSAARSAHALGVAVGVAPLHALGRLPEAGGQVAGVEQRDPQPGLAGRLDQGQAHRVGLVVRRPVGLVVQVVELADRGDAGRDHLAVGRPGRARGSRRGRAARRRRTSARARSRRCPTPRWVRPRRARWKAWLCALASPGTVSPGTRVASGASAAAASRTSREAAVLHGHEHVVVDGAVDPGALEEVGGHEASRWSVSARAATPARQSAVSACSAGEWEMPVGLRTNSIAVGMPASERIPASCPACVAMHRPVAALVVDRHRPGEVGVERHRRRDRLGRHGEARAVAAGTLGALVLDDRRAGAPASRGSRSVRPARR